MYTYNIKTYSYTYILIYSYSYILIHDIYMIEYDIIRYIYIYMYIYT